MESVTGGRHGARTHQPEGESAGRQGVEATRQMDTWSSQQHRGATGKARSEGGGQQLSRVYTKPSMQRVFPDQPPWAQSPPLVWTSQCQSSFPQAPCPSTVRVYSDGVVVCLDTPPFNYLINFPNPRPLINCKGLLQLSSKITHIGAVTGIFLCLGRLVLFRYTKPFIGLVRVRKNTFLTYSFGSGNSWKTGSILNAMDIWSASSQEIIEGSLTGARSSRKAPFSSKTKLEMQLNTHLSPAHSGTAVEPPDGRGMKSD